MPTWSPTQRVTDIRPLSPNLLAYFRTNQTIALNWANGGTGLVDFAVIWNTNEGLFYELFPNVQVLTERHVTAYADEGLVITYGIDLLFEVAGADASQLRVDTKLYGYALESMIMNIPATTFLGAITNFTRPTVEEITIEHGALKGEDSNWMTQSTLRVIFNFTESYQ